MTFLKQTYTNILDKFKELTPFERLIIIDSILIAVDTIILVYYAFG